MTQQAPSLPVRQKQPIHLPYLRPYTLSSHLLFCNEKESTSISPVVTGLPFFYVLKPSHFWVYGPLPGLIVQRLLRTLLFLCFEPCPSTEFSGLLQRLLMPVVHLLLRQIMISVQLLFQGDLGVCFVAPKVSVELHWTL